MSDEIVMVTRDQYRQFVAAEADLAALRAHVADVIARCETKGTQLTEDSADARWRIDFRHRMAAAADAYSLAAAWLREFPKGDEQHG